MEKKLIKLYVAIDEEQDKLLTQEQNKLKNKIGYEISKQSIIRKAITYYFLKKKED